MHQYSRQSPAMASPANADQTHPTRPPHPRDRDLQHLRSTSASNPGSGTSDDFVNTRPEASTDNPTAQMQRLNQVIQNFHTKAVLIVLHSRVELSKAYSTKSNEKRVNRWFNIELDETEDYAEDIRPWRKCDVTNNRPPPLVIEVYLTTDPLAQGQRLVILDDDEKRWDVINALESNSTRNKRTTARSNEVLLERWTIELGEPGSSTPAADLTSILPLVYKKSIVLFRSLYTYCNFLPAWKLARKVGKSRANMAMKLGYRIVDGTRLHELSRPDNLNTALYDSTTAVVNTYSFGETDSPGGPFSIHVQYRENCDFRIDDSEELLSSRFLGVDDDLFKPSIATDDRPIGDDRPQAHVGSLPTDRRRHLMESPELGHAYGSLSTFHQAGFGTGTSPISALRSAKELGQASPSPEPTRPPPQPLVPATAQRNSLRAAAAGRRSSFSFQPFKAPALSASPLGASPLGTSPRTSSTRVPALSSLTEESGLPAPNAQAVAARKSGSVASDNPLPSSTSSSPKPQPSRYSSSFSHRRARLSSDRGASKPDDDQISSGKGSATSSHAPPSSGIIAEAGGGMSSGSMQDDDENISAFLKMLDVQKDRLTSSTAAANDASTKRTVEALGRFQRMRDSNAALSDSMSSSLVVTKPSSVSGRQVTGTSGSTSSSSPNKPPVSPHTPHMPFAPSRLSAAYSHDDESHQHDIVGDAQSAEVVPTERGADEARSSNVPAIDIPNSPRLLVAGYRRSSSAQRRPLSSEEDIGDIFGLRSASMGATERRTDQTTVVTGRHQPAVLSGGTQRPESLDQTGPARLQQQQQQEEEQQQQQQHHHHHHQQQQQPPPPPQQQQQQQQQDEEADAANDVPFEAGSTRSSAPHVYRSRLARGSGLRGMTPPQGSTSSFGGTGGSLERGDSGGSVSGSWGGRGGRFRSGSRPENKFAAADDGDVEEEFLPFAIDKSDFTSGVSER